MSGENNIEFKSEPDNRPNDLVAALSNLRDPARSSESVEAVRTVANQTPPSTENPLAPQSTQIPALPILSSFFGAADAVTPDTVKGAVMDMLKNVTINGVSPNINGGSIDFNVETKPSASQQWNTANGINIPANPPATAAPSNYPTEASNLVNQPTPLPNQQVTPQNPTVQTDLTSETSTPQTKNPKSETLAGVDTPETNTPQADNSKVDSPKVDTLKVDSPKVETPEIDLSMFSMAKPKTLKERARELEEERDADSGGFSMAKPKSLKVGSSRNTIDDVIDQAESESKADNGGGSRRRGKDRIFDRIEDAIENEDYDKARKLNDQVKNRELETELRGEGKDRDRRSTKDIAEAEGIDTSGKSSKELRQEILEKRRGEAEKESASGKNVSDFSTIEVGKQVVELIPIPIRSANEGGKYRMAYAMATAALDFDVDEGDDGDSKFFETLSGSNGSWTNEEYFIASGGPVKFYCYKDGTAGTIELSSSSKFKAAEA